MNEGWATFWHYTLLNTMYDEGLLTDGFMMEFLHSTPTSSIQPRWQNPGTAASTPTPWALPCGRTSAASEKHPTDEDRAGSRTSPAATGGDLRLRDAQLQDESFVAQFLSPKVIPRLPPGAILDDDKDSKLEISAIHDEVRLPPRARNLSDN